MAQDTIVKINAKAREEDKNPRQIRKAGFIPATIYGKGLENSKSIQLDTHEFQMAYKNNQDAKFEIKSDKEKFTVVIQELQMNYGTGEMLNIEFKIV